MLEIILISISAGAFITWALFGFIKKKDKNLMPAIVLLLMLAGCSPGRMVGTGYHTVIEHGRMVWVEKLPNTAETDAFIFEKTGLELITDSLIGKEPPCFRFYNFRYDVYVEHKAIYQRRDGGKERWRRL